MKFSDPEVTPEASSILRTSSQECISITGKWKNCNTVNYVPTNCPCPYENYMFDAKVMICAQGTEKRTGKVIGDSSIEDKRSHNQIKKFWNTLNSSPETMEEFDQDYKRLMKNKCTGDSGSKFCKQSKKYLQTSKFF